ncbi:MAG: SH3 domain-containing protein [Clostridia bacterium]|nr:SH3 domain-containing protein [Clostridia bacterium]
MATGRTKRLTGLLLALLLALALLPAAAADSGIQTGTTVSGTVRVYLSSIGSKTSVDLSVDGSYSVGGDASRAIARGTQMTVRNSGGTLIMQAGGQSQTMGSRFKLRRHQTSGENGVRIAQARYPSNLYPGDVEFIAKGGNVQIIIHVYMEDYMRGVLPYEMDNSFPLEALKAQAVAARTYALKKMSAQAATYDLVDTTSDQVYNGTPAGNARCVQAVEETSGVVGTVGGEYMASYYTASNGGQTESVANAWGSGSYSYLQVKDDPYDLRNGASIAKSVTFYRDGRTSVSALTELLRTEAAALVGAHSVSIEAITGVTPHTPKYGAESRVYRKVDVGLTLSGYGHVTVTLDYFSQIESMCSMSINVLKNETLAVSETVGGYKLTARRFGHGVGMSQRGAQQMAAEGIAYDEILQFYYPGLVRTRYTMTRTILPSMDGTPGAEEDIPVTDARTAIVTLNNPLDSLNLRSAPSTTAPILATMPHGTQITLLSQADGWSRVQYGTLSGYVKNEYITVQDDEVDETPPETMSRGTATVALSDESQTLNLRAAPTMSAAVIAHLRHGQTLNVLERYESWTYVQMGALSGYVMNDYIIYDADGGQETPQPTPTPVPENGKRTAAIVLPFSGLNLRTAASADSAVIMTLPQGTMLSVTGAERGGMLPVSIGGLNGFVAAEYVYVTQVEEPTPVPEPTAEPTPTPKPFASYRAVVTAESGLKLRRGPGASHDVMTTMPYGATVTVRGEAENGYLPVSYGELTGYAGADYLRAQNEGTPIPVPTATPVPPASTPVEGRTGTVTAISGLNLRQEPYAGAQLLATLGYGVNVTVTGERTNGFYPVRVGTLSGYASADYISFDAYIAPQATPAPTQPPMAQGYRVVVDSDNGLNLRARPDTSGEVLYVLPYGMVLTVLGESENGFLQVTWSGYTGYVAREYVTPFGAQ